MPPINRIMGRSQWLMLIALSVLWGGSFFFVGVAVAQLPPLTIVLLRVGIAALTLWIVVLVLRVPLPQKLSQWAALFVMGFINNVIPFVLIVWGQTQIASGLASILNATTPLFTVLVAGWILADESFSASRLFAVVIGFVGVLVMMGPDLWLNFGGSGLAQTAVLGAALSYAFASVFGRRFVGMNMAPIMTATGQVTASTIMLTPVVLLADKPWQLPIPAVEVIVSVVALAVFSTALAYILFFKILAASGATNLMLVTLLIPVSAVLLGTLVLDETLTVGQVIGMLLIGVGLLALDGRVLQRKS